MNDSCAAMQAQLGDYLDGQLEPAAHEAVRAHLEGCADCSGVVADLERIVATARTLGPMSPPDHIWLEVAGQIRLAGRRSTSHPARVRPRSPVWQWAGLAAALVVITGIVWLGTIPDRAGLGVPLQDAAAGAATAPAAGTMEAVAAELDRAQEHSKRALAELMATASDPASPLDTSVAVAVQQNMDAIDRAIGESRAALGADPGNEPARDSLFDALRRKISVLQATLSLINQMRQGDQEGAARSAESLGKKS